MVFRPTRQTERDIENQRELGDEADILREDRPKRGEKREKERERRERIEGEERERHRERLIERETHTDIDEGEYR